MTTTAKRSNDDSTGTPAPKRSATDTATSVVDANWKELDFGKPFANKYDGFPHRVWHWRRPQPAHATDVKAAGHGARAL